ncbi:MAG: hypothetical protein K2N56_11510 [Oscillospiraceae bacterium]|nr:hypothetical protein [Oscillospiraceae bacterium]
MFIVLGIIFSVIGLVMIGYSVRQAVSMRGGYELDARIVDYEKKTSTHHHNGHRTTFITYAPVYEYVDAGETKRHTSIVFVSVMPKIGKETTVFISSSGEIVDRGGVVGVLICGIIFVVFGVIAVVVGLKG